MCSVPHSVAFQTNRTLPRNFPEKDYHGFAPHQYLRSSEDQGLLGQAIVYHWFERSRHDLDTSHYTKALRIVQGSKTSRGAEKLWHYLSKGDAKASLDSSKDVDAYVNMLVQMVDEQYYDEGR